jgi:hypothetical protein
LSWTIKMRGTTQLFIFENLCPLCHHDCSLTKKRPLKDATIKKID